MLHMHSDVCMILCLSSTYLSSVFTFNVWVQLRNLKSSWISGLSPFAKVHKEEKINWKQHYCHLLPGNKDVLCISALICVTVWGDCTSLCMTQWNRQTENKLELLHCSRVSLVSSEAAVHMHVHESKWMFVPDVMELSPGVSELQHWRE